MQMLDLLKRRHARLDHELAAEQARRAPDTRRVALLKKLKLAVKDRMLMAQAARAAGRGSLPA